jgi:hypothetical protein
VSYKQDLKNIFSTSEVMEASGEYIFTLGLNIWVNGFYEVSLIVAVVCGALHMSLIGFP